MNLGIVTTVHSGYGRFFRAWCNSLRELDPPAGVVTVALGPRHGVSPPELARARRLLPHLTVVRSESRTLGVLRNAAISQTHTDWIMVLDVDDVILPWAVEEFAAVEDQADVILLSWLERRVGKPDRVIQQLTPEQVAHEQRGRGFFNNSLPYRRSLWELEQYAPNQYPGAMFMVGLVEAGARIVKTSRPCDVHVRHPDSFSHRTLNNLATKREAYALREAAAERLRAFYGAE